MSENLNPNPIDISNISTTEYVWPAYWGGVTRSQKPPLIHTKLRDLRLAIGGLSAKKQAGGPMFPVKSAKELANKLGQALTDLNLIAPVTAQEVSLIPTADIPGNATASGKPVFRTLAHVKATVRIGAEDGSFVDVVGSGHGGDTDDKAGGKATTYAWKDALLKGLSTPEQNMVDTDDESSEQEVPAPRTAPKRETPRAVDLKPDAGGTGGSEAGNVAGADQTGLARAKAAFSAARDIQELDAAGADAKAGKYGVIAGSDKVSVATHYVKCKTALAGLTKVNEG